MKRGGEKRVKRVELSAQMGSDSTKSEQRVKISCFTCFTLHNRRRQLIYRMGSRRKKPFLIPKETVARKRKHGSLVNFEETSKSDTPECSRYPEQFRAKTGRN